MERARVMPCVLVVAGLDPGGGAGVLSDARAVARAGAFACGVVAVSTVQSTAGMVAARPVDARWVRAQVDEVLARQRVRAVKVGALGSAANVRAVAAALEARPDLPLVLDVPMVASAGRGRLLARRATETLVGALLPRANLVTANTHEAEALAGRRVRSIDDARGAARALVALGAQAALVKGGHLAGPRAIDVLVAGERAVELSARRVPGGGAHGTGCTFASLVAGRLALRPGDGLEPRTLVAAVRWAKRVHAAELARAVDVGEGQRVLVLGPR